MAVYHIGKPPCPFLNCSYLTLVVLYKYKPGITAQQKEDVKASQAAMVGQIPGWFTLTPYMILDNHRNSDWNNAYASRLIKTRFWPTPVPDST